MMWNEKVVAAFDNWASYDTWWKNQEIDDDRWFGFIRALDESVDPDDRIDADELKDEVIRRLGEHHGPLTDRDRELAEKRVRESHPIIDYLNFVRASN